jgi:hypothetical protein
LDSFHVGDVGYPQDDDATYTNTDFIGQAIRVYREGERMFDGDTTFGIEFDDSIGEITFYPLLTAGERIIIEILDSEVVSGGGGTVTNVSVTTANGFSGTVATSTSTPAITLQTTVTGILKGNGTAVSAASAGTDYAIPITRTLITSDTTLTTQTYVAVDATSSVVTITLPAAASNTNKIYTIKKIDSTNSVVIDPNGSETIDGSSTITLTTQWDMIKIISNGTNWEEIL